jgi:hypothetical protein
MTFPHEEKEPAVAYGTPVTDWDFMPKARQELHMAVARRNAAAYRRDGSGCFICALIVEGVVREELAGSARKRHLLLCCNPDLDSNREAS